MGKREEVVDLWYWRRGLKNVKGGSGVGGGGVEGGVEGKGKEEMKDTLLHLSVPRSSEET